MKRVGIWPAVVSAKKSAGMWNIKALKSIYRLYWVTEYGGDREVEDQDSSKRRSAEEFVAMIKTSTISSIRKHRRKATLKSPS